MDEPARTNSYAGLLITVASLSLLALAIQAIAFSQSKALAAAVAAFFIFVVATMLTAWLLIRNARRRGLVATVISQLEQATRLNLPLPQVMAVVGDGERSPWLRRELDRINFDLTRGAPLADALAGLPGISPRLLAFLASAESAGQLQPALTRVISIHREQLDRRARAPLLYSSYPYLITMLALFLSWMLTWLVFPKFAQIANDFRMELPWPTKLAVTAARIVGISGVVLLLTLLLAALVHHIARRWSWIRWDAHERLVDHALDRIPLLGAARMQDSLGRVFLHAADSLDAGRALDASIMEASEIASSSLLRQRLAIWVAAINAGASPRNAASAVGLPELVSGMLGGAAEGSGFASVLRFLGNYYATRFSRLMVLLLAAVVPAVAVLMGVVVAWMGICIFLPMSRWIDLLSQPQLRF